MCGLVQSRRIAAAGVAAMLLIGSAAFAAPITTKEGVLPLGSDLGETVADQPTELFATELAGGKRSYMQKLGDMLFSSPAILGGVARQAGISCATCHQQGAGNAALYIPGLSSRPGNFDTRDRHNAQRLRCNTHIGPNRNRPFFFTPILSY